MPPQPKSWQLVLEVVEMYLTVASPGCWLQRVTTRAVLIQRYILM